MAKKTDLRKVNGYTPVIDHLITEFGYLTALVFGVIWRYCQMENGECTASQSTMAGLLGIKRQTFMRHADLLAESGYLEKQTISGIGVIYNDTGKANLLLKVTRGVIKSDTGCNSNGHVPVIKSDTKIVFKDSIKNNNKALEIYRKVTGLTPDYMNLEKVEQDIISAAEQRDLDEPEFITYLEGVYHNWKNTKSKEGRPYSPQNPKWIEWAITGRFLEGDKTKVIQGKEGGFYA